MANTICHADLFELSTQGNISTRRRANVNLVHSLVFQQKTAISVDTRKIGNA